MFIPSLNRCTGFRRDHVPGFHRCGIRVISPIGWNLHFRKKIYPEPVERKWSMVRDERSSVELAMHCAL